jgi:putative transposase
MPEALQLRHLPCRGLIRLSRSSAAEIDELLNGEVLYTLKEASVVIEQWRGRYSTVRPHSSLSYQPPAPEVVIWPTEPNGSVPLALPAIVTRPTVH